MGKRISRRELIEKIKSLQFDLTMKNHDLCNMIMERDKLKKRIMDIGSRCEMLDISGPGINCVEVRPEAWGQYMVMSPLIDLSDTELEDMKKMLVGKIVQGLMEQNVVQFIIGKHDFVPDRKTIAAKLYVVPWDQLVSRTIKVQTWKDV